MNTAIKKISLGIAGIFMVMSGGFGCAAGPAKPAGMTLDPVQGVKRYPYSVSIKASGGSNDNDLGLAYITNEALAKAVKDSIMNSKLFAKIVEKDNADYLLSIEIFGLEQQPMGFSMTSRIEVGWNLVKEDTGNRVMRKMITSSYTAPAGAAFSGVARIRMATEGAARKNIEMGIEAMAALNL